ncbi:MAG TPA: FlgD immunoglobulin-like domain containing protein [Pyrinomonadaceae bacterium]|nr:FlgD immunoglobulin-like domain containing protein [Pyrinomonadaceae bacterium]
MKKQVAMLLILGLGLLACVKEKMEIVMPGPGAAPQNSQGLSIYNVTTSATSFNPSRGDKLELRYSIPRDARVSINIYDADRQLVRTLAEESPRKVGQNKETWDGKDLDGAIVPNEAYFFCVEAVDSSDQKVVYDPITFSGGESADITQGGVSRETGTLTYKLSQPSRVLMRAGVPGSALLKTVVDWQPRVAGEITEYWNGKDEDNLIDVLNVPNYLLILSYMTLPETSVITVGNEKYDYRAYKASLKSPRPVKAERAMTNGRKISPHFFKSRVTDRAFKVKLSFPELGTSEANDIPAVKGNLLVRVAAAEEDKDVISNQQFEIILFVNNVFYAEEERGYLPFNFPVELASLAPGEYVITVNVITFGDQIGIGSRKIRVVK